MDYSEKIAQEALRLGENIPSIKAEALNNLAFCAFIRMDFEKAGELLKEVYKETTNELECLVADVGMMKICQRTAMNKEFYDYRNSALRRMKRISEDESAMNDTNILRRFNYAKSEFSITSAIYYYYLQQEKQSLMSIDEVEVDNGLEDDTAQLLYFYYMKGSGGMYEAETSEDVVVGEFDYLVDCLMLSHEQGYVYFEANASQAMAELLKDETVAVQGVIDIFFEDADGKIVLCDYKTDRLTREELKDGELARKTLSERHGEQLGYYSLALERIMGRRPDRVCIFSLHAGREFDVI